MSTVDAGSRRTARPAPGRPRRANRRQPGEERTALWMVRHAAHEGTHHLADLRDISGR
jgi:hypothetical protein